MEGGQQIKAVSVLGSCIFCKLQGPNKNELVIFKNKLVTL